MTVRELIDLLAEYPDDTPVFHWRGEDLHARQVTDMAYDDWDHATRGTDAEGVAWETPAVGRGVHLGRRW
ncbi:MAG TPA: hypothetical protein VKE26_26260 [Xanthobacteraceae bacterium]|nr:hypothetical protein [Xanthobacteraceae bacterium]